MFNKFKSELDISNIYIASALNFPDALSSSALAAKTNSFVLLSNPTVAETNVKSLIITNAVYINKVYVLGSNQLIIDSVLSALGITK